MFAPLFKLSIKFPKLYLNGIHTVSGACFFPISRVFFVMGGANITCSLVTSFHNFEIG